MHGKIIKFKGDISELDTAGYAILGLKYLEEHKDEKN